MQSLIKAVTHYLRSRTIPRMLFDAFVVAALTTWIGFIFVVSTNFDTIKVMYDKMMAPREDVQIETVVAQNALIDKELIRIIDETKADRVVVSKFHNGKVDLTGTHFVYISRTHERVGPGISTEIRRNQNVPISFFNAWLSDYFLKRSCVRIETIDTNAPYAQFMAEQGTRAMLNCPIVTAAGTLVGYVGVEYVHSRLPKSDIPMIETRLRSSASLIGGILSVTATK